MIVHLYNIPGVLCNIPGVMADEADGCSGEIMIIRTTPRGRSYGRWIRICEIILLITLAVLIACDSGNENDIREDDDSDDDDLDGDDDTGDDDTGDADKYGR